MKVFLPDGNSSPGESCIHLIRSPPLSLSWSGCSECLQSQEYGSAIENNDLSFLARARTTAVAEAEAGAEISIFCRLVIYPQGENSLGSPYDYLTGIELAQTSWRNIVEIDACIFLSQDTC